MLYLKAANYDDIEKEWLFQRSIPVDENGFINDYHGISRQDFGTALDTIIAQSRGECLPEGYVPQTVYYLLDDDTIVGTFHFRHYLTEALAGGSGHIGYYIAPEYRGRGCGTQGLKLLLDEIRGAVAEEEIYLRVNRDNPASLRVMLSNGGYIHHEDEDKYYVRIPK
ncbi:GNAT family N-acetyltransferase [Ruminococcus sp.]|uniref:GNAT family N-acetyltransferase n=1 Tax=Ruminococcus sp. TaxID=41978 RepID=UPI002C5179AC|nr:GNAT family N-acetyltransferase [Ruminococcus sp.]HNZ99596.1 GNAT family N-acetyltransferase [Ruminococcus sp.]HOH86357.1 GNAT family N-acetyltransferase [Ruminococcus sp.]